MIEQKCNVLSRKNCQLYSLVAINDGPNGQSMELMCDEQSYKEHHFYKSIDQVNIWGLPFLPQATEIVEQFLEHSIEKVPEEIQEEGILPRGTKEEWESSLEEKAFVGTVSNDEEYRGYIQQGFYQLPVRMLKKGWNEAKYVALYTISGVGENGITEYGEIKQISTADEYVHFL